MSKTVPGLALLREPGFMIARIIVGIMFVLGGILAFLPVLGIWMLPLGILILAIDIPVLQGPITRLVICGRRRFSNLRRRLRAKRAA